MSVTIEIPTALRHYAGGKQTVTADGADVAQALGHLVSSHPDLKKHLYSEDGKLRNFVNVFLNNENIRHMQGQAVKLKDGDTLTIVPAVAGGSGCGCGTGTACATTAEPVTLSNEEVQRYSRHLILPEVGMDGQKKLKAASILLIGAGGLGSPLAMYLSAAGIGRIGIVDFDVVDFSNLQRQIMHGTQDVGRPKIDSARESIKAINPNVVVETYNVPLTSENAMEIVAKYDIVIDGTDNFPTRYLVNDACVLLKKPNVYGSIFRFDGQASIFNYQDGPCYRCLYPEPPEPGMVPSCAEGGVLGILPGIIGIIQATEAIKIILGAGVTLKNRLLLFDALAMKIRRDPNCPACGDKPTVTKLIDYKQFCGIPEGPTAQKPEEQAKMARQSDWDITCKDVKSILDAKSNVLILDVREPHEWQICNFEKLGRTKLIPLGQLGGRMGEIDRNEDIIVHCRSGGRSAKAVNLLRTAGYTKVRNMQGGTLAWSDQVDSSVPKY